MDVCFSLKTIKNTEKLCDKPVHKQKSFIKLQVDPVTVRMLRAKHKCSCFRGMRADPRGASAATECSSRITPTDMTAVDNTTMKYLAKKLFNLSMLLEQDTVSEDVSYPKFAC